MLSHWPLTVSEKCGEKNSSWRPGVKTHFCALNAQVPGCQRFCLVQTQEIRVGVRERVFSHFLTWKLYPVALTSDSSHDPSHYPHSFVKT